MTTVSNQSSSITDLLWRYGSTLRRPMDSPLTNSLPYLVWGGLLSVSTRGGSGESREEKIPREFFSSAAGVSVRVYVMRGG